MNRSDLLKIVLPFFLLPAPVLAQEPDEVPIDEGASAEELARRIDVLAGELERLRLGEVAPRADSSVHGMGPAASKVYHQDQGVSIGGYGEVLYENRFGAGAVDTIDFYRAILYTGYKFSDRWVLNTELEIEHVDEVYLEFAYLDYLWRPEVNFRAGLVLVPMGLVNELHEPTVFLGALRSETERRILPSTWRENGVGVFGDVGSLSYRAYLLNGMRASGFSAAGLRGGRQKGARALANDFAGVARVDYLGLHGLLAGGSVYYGGAGQELAVDVSQLIFEGHLDYQWRGLELRALYAQAHVGGVSALNDSRELIGTASVGERMQGWYAQLGYDVLSLLPSSGQRLVPFVRYEEVDTHVSVPAGFERDPAQDVRTITVGAGWLPIEQIVLKVDYQQRTNREDTSSSQLNVLVGYIF